MTKQKPLLSLPTEGESIKSLINTVIDQKYRIVTQLRSNSTHFDVYLANVIGTKEQVTVKIEKTHEKAFALRNEYHALMAVQSVQRKIEEIQRSYWFGTQEENTFLVCQLMGPSLDNLLKTCDKSFTLKTILMLGEQMVKRLKLLHRTGYVHRDIKPQNFCIGLLDKSSSVYLANLGNAKQYKSSKTGFHKLYSEHNDTSRSSKFSSVNSDLGIEPSRRDDLESLIYVLIYFFKGVLPWENVYSNSALEKFHKMMISKRGMPAEVLCKGMPDCFAIFLKYCKELKYMEKPDYKYLRNLLKRAAGDDHIVFDGNYDWVKANRTNSQNAIYQFRDMAISFQSTTAASHIEKSENDKMLFSSQMAPSFRKGNNIAEKDPYIMEEGYDNIIPHDLGISDMTNNISFPSKSLMATVVKSNDAAYPRVPNIESNTMEKAKKVRAQYSIVLTEEDGTNYELENNNGKILKTFNEQSVKEATQKFVQNKLVKADRELAKHGTFEEDEGNTKKFSRKSIENEDEVEDTGREKKEKGGKKGKKKSLKKDKDDKNCEIF